MNTLRFTASEKGVVVTGKSFDVKEILKSKGASWDSETRVWIFRGQTDLATVTASVTSEVEAAVTAAVKAKKAARKAEKAYLATPDGQAAAVAAAKARVIAERASVNGHWICCDECVVMDWGRQHTSCNTHGFCRRGCVFTGD